MTMLDDRPHQDRDVMGTGEPGSRRAVPNGVVDVLAVVGLTALGLWGFRAAYGGIAFLVVGLLGLALGVVLAYLGFRTRQSTPVVLALGLVVVVALSGAIALRPSSIAGVLPTLDTVTGLAQGVTRGWIELVTTPSPVGSFGNLLAIPYLCGFLTGLLGLTAALRSRRMIFAVLPPILVLAAGILTGAAEPVSLLLQGGLFAAVVAAWSAHRGQRDVQVDTATTRRGWGRAGIAVALVAVAAVAGLALGGHLPGATSNPRLLLRSYVDPDIDVSQYPSPLASVRRYLKKGELRDQVLFEVAGDLPGGTPLRLAVLDTWDGTAAGVAGSVKQTSSGVYSRVGDTVPTTVEGTAHHVTITVRSNKAGADGRSKTYSDVWVPTLGGVTAVSVSGARSDIVRRDFRYNLATDSALVTSGLSGGTVLDYDVLIPSPRDDIASLPAAPVAQQFTVAPPTALSTFAGDHAGENQSPYASALGIVKFLTTQGYYTPRDVPTEVKPGHGFKALADFLKTKQPVGDEEQYGAVAMLASQVMGVPARVVMGFRPQGALSADKPVAVRGKDLVVWLEVDLQGAGWVPVGDKVSPDSTKTPKSKPEPQTVPKLEVQPPPPLTSDIEKPPSVTDTDASDTTADETDTDFALPSWIGRVLLFVGLPLILVGGAVALIISLKSRRARRRRERLDPIDAVTGGWAEVLDLARDHGLAPSVLATRTEAAGALTASVPGAVALLPDLARRADAAHFGPVPPTLGEVESYWADVDSAGRVMLADKGFLGRWRARLALRSLTPVRARRGATHR
jgi:hypothetical protein